MNQTERKTGKEDTQCMPYFRIFKAFSESGIKVTQKQPLLQHAPYSIKHDMRNERILWIPTYPCKVLELAPIIQHDCIDDTCDNNHTPRNETNPNYLLKDRKEIVPAYHEYRK